LTVVYVVLSGITHTDLPGRYGGNSLK